MWPWRPPGSTREDYASEAVGCAKPVMVATQFGRHIANETGQEVTGTADARAWSVLSGPERFDGGQSVQSRARFWVHIQQPVLQPSPVPLFFSDEIDVVDIF